VGRLNAVLFHELGRSAFTCVVLHAPPLLGYPDSRSWARHADAVLTVLEPYYRSLETGARVCDLARELGVKRVQAVANKVRNADDAAAIESFCKARGLDLLGTVPHDDAILEADRAGKALLDRAPGSAAVRAIEAIADRLFQ